MLKFLVILFITPFLNVIINCILARLAAQILPIKDECTFGFSNFLIIGLRNYSANSCFNLCPFLAPPLEDLFKIICKPLRRDLFYIHHILCFLQC